MVIKDNSVVTVSPEALGAVDVQQTLEWFSVVQHTLTLSFWACPGFIDIHNHGIGGAENVDEFWLSNYTTSRIWRSGTTSCLASLTFPEDGRELTRKIISHLKEKCGKV
jgi:N-acetylglucosamine-6-phosphate deacetylase